jgi:hypothetical protein
MIRFEIYTVDIFFQNDTWIHRHGDNYKHRGSYLMDWFWLNYSLTCITLECIQGKTNLSSEQFNWTALTNDIIFKMGDVCWMYLMVPNTKHFSFMASL